MSGRSPSHSVSRHQLNVAEGPALFLRVTVWSVLSVLLVTAAFSSRARAQGTDTALLRGTVTDPTGAGIPGASVTMTNDATKVSETVKPL